MSDRLSIGSYKTPLERLEDAARLRTVARDNYNQAIKDCVAAGINNTKMASVLNVSEAAIRMYRRRNSLDYNKSEG